MKYGRVIEILNEKRKLFLEIERVTEPMYYGEADEIADCMEKRSTLIEKIILLDNEIKELCAGDEPLRDALNNKCNRQGLIESLAEVYDASTGVFAVINRIIGNQKAIEEHLLDEKARIEEKIKETESSGYSVANQYYQSIQTGVNRFASGENSRKI